MFEPADPWVQRAMMRMTSELPSGLRASPEDPGGTWLRAFEAWLLLQGELYPSRDFHAGVREFLDAHGIYHKNLLFAGDQVKAVRVGFALEVDTPILMSEAKELREAWDAHVADRNEEAGLRAKRAWHTSPLWVLVEAHVSIVGSAWLV